MVPEIMITTQPRPFQSFECSVNEQVCYRLRHENLDKASGSRITRLCVEVSRDGGATWRALPIKLTWWSRMLLWASAEPEWPPEITVGMGCDAHQVWFDYMDDLDEQRLGRKHSAWRATYQEKKGKWRLQHLRYLNLAS